MVATRAGASVPALREGVRIQTRPCIIETIIGNLHLIVLEKAKETVSDEERPSC